MIVPECKADSFVALHQWASPWLDSLEPGAWRVVIAALLVGAVLAGVLLPFVGLRGLRAELVAPDEATQGETTHVDVRLWHGGRGVRWGRS